MMQAFLAVVAALSLISAALCLVVVDGFLRQHLTRRFGVRTFLRTGMCLAFTVWLLYCASALFA